MRKGWAVVRAEAMGPVRVWRVWRVVLALLASLEGTGAMFLSSSWHSGGGTTAPCS